MIARELIAVPSFASEVEQGLTSHPKTLPSKLFYDAAGSALFEKITELPEYYLTRTELAILQKSASAMARAVGPGFDDCRARCRHCGQDLHTFACVRAIARSE